jgi:hypothetical protein
MHAIHFFSLCECEVHCRFAAVTACFYVKRHFLVVFQTCEAGTLNCGDVNEDILRSAIGSNKAEAFSSVKPFHGASSHRVHPLVSLLSARVRQLGGVSALSKDCGLVGEQWVEFCIGCNPHVEVAGA